jgi:uncharacterized membrane protein YedE/YeeE
MNRALIALLTGGVFAAGLALSGMTQPQRVTGFLDVTGAWDPTLAFVMGGAILCFAPLYHWAARRQRLAFHQVFRTPHFGTIEARLLVGASVFGVGWGLSGYCPGPALTSLATGAEGILWFGLPMLVGMALHPWIDTLLVRAFGAARDPNDGSPDLEA